MAAKRLKKTLPKNFDDIVASNNLELLKEVFSESEINAKGGLFKTTALSWYGISENFMNWLIDNGSDLEFQSEYLETPLHHHAGAWNGFVQLLIDRGANLEAEDNSGRTPLFKAAIHPANLSKLIGAGANVHHQDHDGSNALLAALVSCQSSDIDRISDSVELLLKAGVSIEPQMIAEVERIGKEFEFIKPDFNPESVEETEKALLKLYDLFGVTAAPSRKIHDGKEPIRVESENWAEQHDELWQLLVPGVGEANTVQGEVVRIVGRLWREIYENGAVNWGDNYRKLVDQIPQLVSQLNPRPEDQDFYAKATKKLRTGNPSDELLEEFSKRSVELVVANPVLISRNLEENSKP